MTEILLNHAGNPVVSTYLPCTLEYAHSFTSVIGGTLKARCSCAGSCAFAGVVPSFFSFVLTALVGCLLCAAMATRCYALFLVQAALWAMLQ